MRGVRKAISRRLAAAQRDYRRLSIFSDRQLNDIGLTRADVDRVLSKPFD